MNSCSKFSTKGKRSISIEADMSQTTAILTYFFISFNLTLHINNSHVKNIPSTYVCMDNHHGALLGRLNYLIMPLQCITLDGSWFQMKYSRSYRSFRKNTEGGMS